LALLLISQFRSISLANVIAQLLLFAPIVCWPLWKTGRLSYVDIGWPFGLAVIGVITLLLADGDYWRKIIVCSAYIFMGLRMGITSLHMLKEGELENELPRYAYQRGRWERAGKTNIPLIAQIEVIMQALGNASFLAIPAFIIASNPSSNYSLFEALGLIIWLGAFALETIADKQKRKFIRDVKEKGLKNQVCNIGLWRYSRHPNYFSEWMVWNALIIAALPSLLALYQTTNILIWGLLGVALIFLSRVMYVTLVYATGAIPSEYYSVQKRPDYKEYQETTNRFFLGPVKK
jgi:steroid 5-alpha reductase family enzyme